MSYIPEATAQNLTQWLHKCLSRYQLINYRLSSSSIEFRLFKKFLASRIWYTMKRKQNENTGSIFRKLKLRCYLCLKITNRSVESLTLNYTRTNYNYKVSNHRNVMLGPCSEGWDESTVWWGPFLYNRRWRCLSLHILSVTTFL